MNILAVQCMVNIWLLIRSYEYVKACWPTEDTWRYLFFTGLGGNDLNHCIPSALAHYLSLQATVHLLGYTHYKSSNQSC